MRRDRYPRKTQHDILDEHSHHTKPSSYHHTAIICLSSGTHPCFLFLCHVAGCMFSYDSAKSFGSPSQNYCMLDLVNSMLRRSILSSPPLPSQHDNLSPQMRYRIIEVNSGPQCSTAITVVSEQFALLVPCFWVPSS